MIVESRQGSVLHEVMTVRTSRVAEDIRLPSRRTSSPPPYMRSTSSFPLRVSSLVFYILSILFLLFCTTCPTSAKFQRGTVWLRASPMQAKDNQKNRFEYLTKFGYKIGSGSFRFRVRVPRPPTNRPAAKTALPLHIFLDEKWEATQKMLPCDRVAHARTDRELKLSPTGEWSEWESGQLHQSVRPHVWFFTLINCDKKQALFQDPLTPDETFPIQFEGEMLQDGGSQFSYELLNTRPIHAFQLVAYLILGAYYVKREMKMIESGGLHPIIQAFNLAIVSQLVATLFHLTHLQVYASNGEGLHFLDLLSDILAILAQVVVSSILLLIGMGYTLTHNDLRKFTVSSPFGRVKAHVIVIGVSVLHALLVAIGKLKRDTMFKFHENEGTIGWLILGMRLAFFFWFLKASNDTAGKVGLQAEAFLKNFRISASLYFLAHPLIFIVTGVWAPYIRHKFAIVGVFIVQLLSVFFIAKLFLTKSEFFRVSAVGNASIIGRFARHLSLSAIDHND